MTLPAAPKDGKYRVLVVEDDGSIARLVMISLTRAGFECRYAPDGLSGFQAFRESDPHLVLLDIMMPGMNGQQLCRKIRETSTIPIIMMTAADSDDAQLQGFKGGADDYIAKPFNPQMLTARLIAHLRRAYRYDAETSPQKETENLPSGWSKCESCGYMGPLSKFEKQIVSGEARTVCPVCQRGDNIAHSIG